MKIVPIPPATRKLVKKVDKLNKGASMPWWHIPFEKLPDQAILAVSTGGGVVRPGRTVYLIAGHNREVFPDHGKMFKLYEYVGLVDGTGWQPLVQLGRDVEMVES